MIDPVHHLAFRILVACIVPVLPVRDNMIALMVVAGMLPFCTSEVKGKPETGDRLRFVYVFVSCVACVRAGEAKLRVRARCRVFLLGWPRLWEGFLRSRPLCEAQDVVYT